MMSFCISFDSAKKAGLLIFLLMQSMVLQAESPDTSITKTEVTLDPSNQDQQSEYSFPAWPERKQVNKEMPPPPPPGPYMSLALTGLSVNESSFGRDLNKSVIETDSSDLPMEAFSPDIPWPENLRPTNRWMPDNGYHYVKPQVKKKTYPAAPYYSRPGGNYGYAPGSNMNLPNMNLQGARGMPSMGVSRSAPSFYAPNYGMPQYGSGHGNPVINNPGVQSGGPVFRAPYPSPTKP